MAAFFFVNVGKLQALPAMLYNSLFRLFIPCAKKALLCYHIARRIRWRRAQRRFINPTSLLILCRLRLAVGGGVNAITSLGCKARL